MRDRIPTTTVRLGQLLREDALTGAVPLNRTIAACRAALDDRETSQRTRDEVRRHLNELLELQGTVG